VQSETELVDCTQIEDLHLLKMIPNILMMYTSYRAFNIFQVYQYFTIYRRHFFSNLNIFVYIIYNTL